MASHAHSKWLISLGRSAFPNAAVLPRYYPHSATVYITLIATTVVCALLHDVRSLFLTPIIALWTIVLQTDVCLSNALMYSAVGTGFGGLFSVIMFKRESRPHHR